LKPLIGVGATLNERFNLETELGQGGMGSVYRATDQLLGRNVAIKVLKDLSPEDDGEQIRLEAQILARLVHDGIVRLYDLGESEGTYFLVMEEVNGPSFASRWRDLRLNERLRICGEVAGALHYAHIQGVIHRDVKPSNVLLTAGDEAKLSDFGLSLLVDDKTDEPWAIRGTPVYMSPEQARGASLNHRTDLYSVGVMLYECATGDLPFAGDAPALLAQHKCAAPIPPHVKNPEIWSTLDRLILSLLAKNPARRPGSGNVVALELFEEAERARRLDRINPGPIRSVPGSDAAPSTTLTVGARHRADNAPNRAAPSDSHVISPYSTGSSELELSKSQRDSSAMEVAKPFRAGGQAASPGHDQAIAREMIAETLASPIVISPEERYLCGHYLAFLLGGARRGGLLLRRPLDGRNADRARLLLAMAWLSCVGPTDEAIARAARLLDERPDVRPALTPIMVVKYLASRAAPDKNRWFRGVRMRLKEASAHAREAMLDSNGVLNPGLMPRTLSDLALIAPPRDAFDAHRVSLWNRIAEVWRQEDEFRQAVLKYSTQSDDRDCASVALWPEVVYALIEHAHWQRTYRSRYEAFWDFVAGKLLHVPVRGVQLDRMMVIAVPLEVAEQLDQDLSTFVEDPEIEEEEASAVELPVTQKPRPIFVGGVIPREELPGDADDSPRVKVIVPLCPADPLLFTQQILRELWEEAMDRRENSTGASVPHRTIPVGPYEMAVMPTGSGRSAVRAGSAVRAVLLGMQQRGKEIEMFTPSALARDSAARPVIAIWTYQDASMAIVYVNFQQNERFILWHAPDAQQINYDHVEELRAGLRAMSLEIPDLSCFTRKW
jgi:serine/threonine-protein kinase